MVMLILLEQFLAIIEKAIKTTELKQGVKEALPYLPNKTGPIPCPSPQIIHSKLLLSTLQISVFAGDCVGDGIAGFGGGCVTASIACMCSGW